MSRWGGLETKTDEELALMRAAGLLVGQTLELLRQAAVPGTTLAELDRLAEENIRDSGGIPSFKGYGHPPFPASICASVNDEIVHGIPTDRAVEDGDLLSIDCGAIVEGWHGDAAITVPIGEVRPELLELSRVCEASLYAGISAMVDGARLSDIGHAIEAYTDSQGAYGILEEYGGHGIGRRMHMDPSVMNYGPAGKGPRLKPGVVLAVEPMITLGGPETRLLADEWTVASADGTAAAHWEHSIAVTSAGPWILTKIDSPDPRL